MQKFNLFRLILSAFCVFIFLGYLYLDKNHSRYKGCWLWAGIPLSMATNRAELYIYQGTFNTIQDTTYFSSGGIAPYPIPNYNHPIYLVFRITNALPSTELIMNATLIKIRAWQLKGVQIAGLQIDFDSASKKLKIYSDFLADLRLKLSEKYKLSITGLCDWLITDYQAFNNLSKNVDEVVFQLYAHKKALDNLGYYLDRMKKLTSPFKVGLLKETALEAVNSKLKENKHYLGSILFIQK